MKSILLLALIVLIASKGHPSDDMRAMVRKINRMHTTWKAGTNYNFDTPLDAKNSLGAILTDPEELMMYEKEIEPRNDLPENFDLRTAHPECESLQEVRDQANCGSCWAFGAAEAMSDRICIASKGKLQTRVSTSDLVTCCSGCGFGCNGGYPLGAFSYWETTGIVSGGLYQDNKTCKPYFLAPCDHHVEKGKYGPCPATVDTPQCEKSCNSEYSTAYDKDKTYGKNSYYVSGEQKIMTELYEKGSLEGAFTVYEDFLLYKSGVYQHVTGKRLGGHAIKVVGWGVENGTKYWLCVNSWNEGWGDNGTFKILRGAGECGIDSQMVGGEPKL